MRYTHTNLSATTDTFTVRDDEGQPIVYNVTITTPPVANSSSATVSYNSSGTPITLSLSGGATTSVAVMTGASHGTVAASGTSISYTPTVGYSGPDSFTYTASNGSGTSAPATVSITVGTPTITIAPSIVRAATVGTAYSESVTAANGMAPYTYNLSAGSLPAGLSLNTSTGALSGTPTAGGVFNFSVRATDSSTGSGTHAYSMTVAAPTVAIAPATMSLMTVGTSYNLSITASGGTAPYSYAITAGSLPAGLSLNTSTGTLSGTPTVAAMYSFTVTATDSSTGSGPYTGARAYSGTVAAAAVPVVTAISPTSGSTTGGTTVTITGTGFVGTTAVRFGATAATGFTVNGATQITAIAPAGTGTIDVRVTTAGGTSATSVADQFTYIDTPTVSSLSPSVGHASGGSTVVITGSGFSGATAVTFGATAATGFTVNSATQITATSPAGTGTVDIRVTTAGGTSATTAADQFTFTEFAVGAVSQTVAYGSSSNAIARNFMGGSPTSVTVASNPAHGSATASGTAISYTPAAGFAGADSFTYTATWGGITSSPATVSITVSPPTQPVTPAASWTATRGVFYTQTLTWSGGTAPYSNYSVSGLPSGLILSNPTATSVVISGTPTHAGSFSVTASARDSSTGDGPFTHHETFTLIVSTASPLAVTPGATTFNATSGTAFSQTFTASGGLAPYTFTQNGTLPAGVTWNAATATLTGEPTASGDFPFSITASDSSAGAPETLTQSYLLKVAHEIPVAPAQSVNSAGPGQPVEINLTSGATGGPFTAANLISVTPANAGSASIRAAGAGYVLRFVPNPDASGVASLSYTLSNAGSTSSPGVISIALSSRSDPSKDAEVQGLLNAQASSSRRFASGQIGNFQQRLEALHSGNVSAFSNGFTLTSTSLQRQRQRQNQNDDPTGIEQWLQIQSAKLQEESSLRASPASAQTPELGSQPGQTPSSPLAIWTSGTISIGDAGGSSGNDQTFVTSGLSVGADYRWTPELTVGLGFGYGHDKTDIGDNGSRSQADSYSLALYGSYQPIENVYLDAVLGYQRLTFDTRRYITDNAGMVHGDRDGGQTFASLALAYEYRQEHWMLSPYARLDLSHGKLDGYEERGDTIFALRYEEQTIKTTSTSLGVRGEYTQTTAIGELTPSLRLEYQHDFQGDGDATMRYVSGSTLYRNKLEALGQDRGVFGFGLGLLTEANWSLHMEYQYTLSSGAQKAQSMLFNLRKPF